MCYEICLVDSVRLALQYQTSKLHIHSLVRTTKLNKICIYIYIYIYVYDFLQFTFDSHTKFVRIYVYLNNLKCEQQGQQNRGSYWGYNPQILFGFQNFFY